MKKHFVKRMGALALAGMFIVSQANLPSNLFHLHWDFVKTAAAEDYSQYSIKYEDQTTMNIFYFKENTDGSNTVTLAVCDRDYNHQAGHGLATYLTLPSTFNCNGQTYKITQIGDGSLSGLQFIGISIPKSVKRIGQSAISNSIQLRSISFESGSECSEIAKNAFNGCEELGDAELLGLVDQKWNLQLPESLKTLGESAFEGCTSLERVTFQSKDTAIGKNAFSNDKKLSTAVLPENSTSIGTSAFENCNSLSAVNIPKKLTKIEDNTFNGCPIKTDEVEKYRKVTEDGQPNDSNGEEITYRNYLQFPDMLNAIGDSAFTGARIVELTIPKKLRTIGDSAFKSCGDLEKINFNDSDLITIGNHAFQGSGIGGREIKVGEKTVLEPLNPPITLSSKVETIGDYAFANTRLERFLFPDNTALKSDGIGAYAFSGCTYLTTFSLPDCITIIKEGTFQESPTLGGISIPRTLTTIGDYAFEGATEFKQLQTRNTDGTPDKTLSHSLITDIGSGAFAGTGFAEFELPKGVQTIASEMFKNCENLKTFTFNSNQLTGIGNNAFSGCSALTSFTLPDEAQLSTLGNSAFLDCSSLKSVDFKNASYTSVPSYCFKGCIKLSEFTLPDTATEISNEAFSNEAVKETEFKGVSELKTIHNIKNITTIGEKAFYNNKKFIGFDKTDENDRSFQLPVTVNKIGAYAFFGCEQLSSIESLGSITQVPESAFSGCTALTEITFPSGLTQIGSEAFSDCKQLTSLTFTSINAPDMAAKSFNFDITKLKKINCDSNLVQPLINKFKNIGLSLSPSIFNTSEREATTFERNGDETFTIAIGQELSLDQDTHFICNDAHNAIATTKPSWSSENSDIAKIEKEYQNEDGTNHVVIKGMDIGKTTIKASIPSGQSIQYTVIVEPTSDRSKVDNCYDSYAIYDFTNTQNMTEENKLVEFKNGSYNLVAGTDSRLFIGQKKKLHIEGVFSSTGESNDNFLWREDADTNKLLKLTTDGSSSGQVNGSDYVGGQDITIEPNEGITSGKTNLTITTKAGLRSYISFEIGSKVSKLDYTKEAPNGTIYIPVNAGTVGFNNYLTVEPKDTLEKIIWKSNNSNAISVEENGNATIKGVGEATVTATSDYSNTSLSYHVIIVNKVISSKTDKEEIGNTDNKDYFYPQDTRTVALTNEVLKSDLAIDENGVKWVSSNDEIVTVTGNAKSGTVTAVAPGYATIKLMNVLDEEIGSFDVTVSTPSIELKYNNMTLYTKISKRKTYTIKPKILGHSKSVTYKSSKKSVASVSSSGKITAKKKGKAKITITANGVSETITVTVNSKIKKKLSVTTSLGKIKKKKVSIKKSKKSLAINVNASWQVLNATYKSSNKKVATVNKNGVLKLKKKGKSKITVTVDGYKTTFTLTVK